MSLRDIVRTDVVTIQLDDTLADAARAMREAGVGSLVVLNARDQPCGVVTDRDLVVFGLAGDDDAANRLVNDVMAADVFSVAPDAGVLETTRRMREERVRRVPVVEDGALVGIVTLDDFVALLSEELANLAAVVTAESPPPEERRDPDGAP
jgi:CBS domain-containing protein